MDTFSRTLFRCIGFKRSEIRGWSVSLALADRPTPGPHRGDVNDRASKQPALHPIWVQLKLQSPDGKHPQQTFANTKSHTIRTGTANTPHTPDRTQIRDGSFGRRQAGTKTPQEREKSVLFAAPESPDDLSDSGGGIRKRTRTVG